MHEKAQLRFKSDTRHALGVYHVEIDSVMELMVSVEMGGRA